MRDMNELSLNSGNELLDYVNTTTKKDRETYAEVTGKLNGEPV